jgi:transposase InsO family protein
MTEGSVAERVDLHIEPPADPRDLRLRDPRIDPQRLDQIIDRSGRDTLDIGLHDHRVERLIDAASRLEQRREETAVRQFRDLQLDIASLRREDPRPVTVPLVHAAVGTFIGLRADHVGRFELDQFLHHEPDRVADQIDTITRWRVEGDTAFEPRSRRPTTSPNATDPAIVERIVGLRDQLTADGLDGGADTIGWHLEHHHHLVVSRPTIHRILVRHERVEPAPKKRPKSSYLRFEAEQPNECWQSDFTHYPLADGTDTEILSWLDDHSRYALRITAHQPVTAKTVLAEFRNAINEHGPPQSTLTDNGMVYTVRFATGPGGRTGFETELRALKIRQKNSRPNHPTTCGKVERFQQTLKKWLKAQPAPAALAELQARLDEFRDLYNQQRPHRSLPHRATPVTIYNARPKATPTGEPDVHYRVRRDRIDDTGTITLRVESRLHHIGIGRTHARTHVIVLVDDHHIRVVDAATGELLRELTLNPNRDYQPTGKPKNKQSEPN